jgi:thiol-disulfide isomerase/thioredoxin
VGRLPALTLALALGACDGKDKDPPLAPKARSQAVAGTGAPAATPAATATATEKPANKPPRKLCDGQLGKPGKAMPKSDVSRTAAPGAPEPEGTIPVGGGKWTWINFWAAWCVPCKEEMPRLIGWEKKLATDGRRMRLVFLSLDDDPRQLAEFLKSQPNSGVRSTFWLREGKEREDWLTALDIDTDPELPAHVLVDPSGKARCVINGAVEDSDYPAVAALVGG